MNVSLTRSGLKVIVPSTTVCVLLPSFLLSEIGQFDHATQAGALFTFSKARSPKTLQLSVTTLASAAPGVNVLVDPDGSGKWYGWNVSADNNGAFAGGSVVPSTTPAAAVSSLNGQPAPAVGTRMTLLGAAVDGTTWFTTGDALRATVMCGAMSTVGALVGSLAVVQGGDGWVVAQL